jgi:phosphatidylinositol glycan class V
MDPIKRKVVFTALASRVFVWCLAVIADFFIPNHDAGVFLWTVAPEVPSPTVVDRLIGWVTDALTKWDGQYFLHIANSGYTYENTLAFFPAYPILVRVVGEMLYWLQVDYGFLHFHTTLKLAGILVNIGLFTVAAVALYELSWRLLKDEYLAYKSALLFCLNPASIFFSATYSESLHAAVTFYLMTKLEKGFSFFGGILLALSSLSRSNALLNLGFVGYKCLKMIVSEITLHQWLKKMGKHELSSTIANILGDVLMPAAFCTFCTIGPFAFYQWYGFTQFCGLTKPSMDYDQVILDYANNHSLRLPSEEPSEWCFYEIPMPYNYIQSHYWDVGFLRYFHWQQIPNFALAAPMISFVLWQSRQFFVQHKTYSLKLGLTIPDPTQRSAPSNYATYGARGLPKECFVYVVHAAFLAAFSLFFIHVEVATRMLASSTPVIYWWAAVLTTPLDRKPVHATVDGKRAEESAKLETPDNLQSNWRCLVIDERQNMSKIGVWIINYFVLYACVGTIMFANFLPWT